MLVHAFTLVCARMHPHTHTLTPVLTCTRVGSHASVLPCSVSVCACIRSDTRACTHRRAPAPTRTACARTPLHSCTHECVCALASTPARVCSHACAGAPQRPALPLHRGSPGRARGPGAARRGQAARPALAWGEGASPRPPPPAPWCPEGTQRPWGSHLAGKGTVAVPTPTPLLCWAEPGTPEPAQHQQHNASSLGTATRPGPPPLRCHPRCAEAVSARYNATTVTQALCPPLHAPLGRGSGTAPCPDPAWWH